MKKLLMAMTVALASCATWALTETLEWVCTEADAPITSEATLSLDDFAPGPWAANLPAEGVELEARPWTADTIYGIVMQLCRPGFSLMIK